VVLPECLDYAILTNQKFGIWGGKSERERRVVRKEMQAGKTIFEIVGMSLTT
jgi:WhiB family redox-sensing transcriptional regulator